jgi:hypothetical protein
MESTSFQFREVLKKDGHKSRDILGSFLCCTLMRILVSNSWVRDGVSRSTHHTLPIVGIAETNAYWLINEEDVCVLSPALRVIVRATGVADPARPKFHEKA